MNDLEQIEVKPGDIRVLPNEMRFEPPHPLTLVQMAMEKGTPIDQLGKLFDLIERNERNQARNAFFQALTAFKKDPPEILKTKEVSFNNTHYRHAELGEASVVIAQALGNHGLSHRWKTTQMENGMIEVTCILSHELGHSECATLRSMPDASGGKNSIQAIGSATSYLQRYTLFAVTGLSAQDDDDGAGADPTATITEDQGKELKALLEGKNVDAFWGWVSEAAKKPISRLGEIPAVLFDKCVDRAKKARKQG